MAARLVDIGVSSEPAALAYGLDFIPLATNASTWFLPAKQAASREVQGLLKVLTSPGCSLSSPASPAATRPAAANSSAEHELSPRTSLPVMSPLRPLSGGPRLIKTETRCRVEVWCTNATPKLPRCTEFPC
jgi:hypothetical protein